ncbi:MAG: DUF192 domain-containing protein [Steroidobacteraceae bacterium]
MPRILRMAVNDVPCDWQVRCCDTFLSRARGRLGSTRAQAHQAWRLHPCRAVHTFFLSEPIDVVFCDSTGRVVGTVPTLRPWRCVESRVASSTWEFPAGTIARIGLCLADRLTSC